MSVNQHRVLFIINNCFTLLELNVTYALPANRLSDISLHFGSDPFTFASLHIFSGSYFSFFYFILLFDNLLEHWELQSELSRSINLSLIRGLCMFGVNRSDLD